MSTKTKTTKAKSKKENLAALGLPALWERFKEATGETTKSPNKKFLVRRIEEALAARAVEPAPAEELQRPTRTSARVRAHGGNDGAHDERRAEAAARAVRGDDHRGAADEVPRGRRPQHGQ